MVEDCLNGLAIMKILPDEEINLDDVFKQYAADKHITITYLNTDL